MKNRKKHHEVSTKKLFLSITINYALDMFSFFSQTYRDDFKFD